MRARFFEQIDAIIFEHPAQFDRGGCIIRAIGIGIDGEIVAKRLAHRRDQRGAAPGVSIFIAALSPADLDLAPLCPGLGNGTSQCVDFLIGGASTVKA